ncbi:Zinc finger protein ZAT2 [Camellia lanceoleosa]|uniref:Zinc finger protein ZAT2 n=1 Tax=Camellia lanceoleosa TaxID=1840588 RepID=A0ACC0FJE1_9ERIC|nr:Zinc finger protein ZAT2 [Camellia lanceoleosa]
MMLMMENTDQPPRIKHFCKVCNKGFSCGGALGGHMRAHGIEDLNNACNNGGLSMSEFQNQVESSNNYNKRTYFLRTTTTNRFITYRAREECGKKSFLTLNSLIERGKYSIDGTVCPMPLLSPTRVGSFRPSTIMGKYDKIFDSMDEEEDLAKCLVMLSNRKDDDEEEDKGKEVVVKGMFQCKACKKVFKSHQALGGHRASHKKVKGCFASRFDNTDDNNEDIDVEKDVLVQANLSPLIHNLNQTSLETSRKSKVHECSICHRVFSSGQALGGHKRCHWLTSNMPDSTYSTIIPKFHEFQHDNHQLFKKPMFEKSQLLDLNLPASLDGNDEARINRDNPSNFGAVMRIYLPPRGKEDMDVNHKKSEGNSEEHCEVKISKLSDLRDMSLDGEYSTWLQVGIVPTTDGGTGSSNNQFGFSFL